MRHVAYPRNVACKFKKHFMETKKLITYSLLAHINNTGTLVNGLLDIYVPIVKKSLSDMNRKGVFSGKNISEIQKVVLNLFSIDIPIPVLRNILQIIGNEIVQGGLVCGPVLAYSPEDFFPWSQDGKQKLSENQFEGLKSTLNTLAHITPGRVKSLSEMLFITASYLSDKNYTIVEKGFSLEQQNEINSYIQYIKTMECNPDTKNRYPIEKEKTLLDQISKADAKGAKTTLNEILGSVFFSSGNNFEIIKSRILELVVLLSRAALKGGADVEQIFGLNFQYINKIHSFTSVEELSYWLSRIMLRFTNLVFTLKSIKHTDAIYKAIHYLNSNYTEKITLEDVASEIFLSSAYFSKIFKEQTGKSFSQYLNNLRIEKSKSLLRNSRIPIVDIAGMVGYEDQSYFTKVFKKVTGNSPGKFRDTRGLIESDNLEIHK